MKLLFAFLVLAALFLGFAVQATPTPFFLYGITNATVTIPNMQAQPGNNPVIQNGTVTHGALTATNALSVNIYSVSTSTSTNSRVFLGTWYPTTTNAAVETIPGNLFIPPTNYLSIDIVTTNAVSLTGNYGY